MATLIYIIKNILAPISVAVATYYVVNRLGENEKKKNYSRLGIAIIDSLLEEIDTGITVMTAAMNALEDKSIVIPPGSLLPKRSWNGLSTIPDDVLLRILATSAKRSFKGFHPRDCRIHCKNYFGNICETYEYMLNQTVSIAVRGVDWRPPIKEMLGDDSHQYLESTRGVAQMLRDAKQLLEENTKKICPK
jgi:hypothetical protein